MSNNSDNSNPIPEGFINIKIETYQPDSQRVSRRTNTECQSFTIQEFMDKYQFELHKAFQDMMASTAKEILTPTVKTEMK